MEELIKALELGKPTFDGEDINYDVATIENAIRVIKKYAEIKKIVEEFYVMAAHPSRWRNHCDPVEESWGRILDIFNDVCYHDIFSEDCLHEK